MLTYAAEAMAEEDSTSAIKLAGLKRGFGAQNVDDALMDFIGKDIEDLWR